jgi:hypothetical protein
MVKCHEEQSLALHTTTGLVEGSLRKAAKEADEWKKKASAALKEIEELKRKLNEA